MYAINDPFAFEHPQIDMPDTHSHIAGDVRGRDYFNTTTGDDTITPGILPRRTQPVAVANIGDKPGLDLIGTNRPGELGQITPPDHSTGDVGTTGNTGTDTGGSQGGGATNNSLNDAVVGMLSGGGGTDVTTPQNAASPVATTSSSGAGIAIVLLVIVVIAIGVYYWRKHKGKAPAAPSESA